MFFFKFFFDFGFGNRYDVWVIKDYDDKSYILRIFESLVGRRFGFNNFL